MDVFTKEKRSLIMSKVKGKNTKPELIVRSLLHRMGYRFRLHRFDLPGNPDIVLPRYKKAIFIHGCFWHGHKTCSRSKRPSTNTMFWNKKLSNNIRRDIRHLNDLKNLGWEVLVVWECQVKNGDGIKNILEGFIKAERKG